MSGNTEPRNSRRMTVIEEDVNKTFWSMSQEYEEAQANYEQDDPVEDVETTDGASSGDREDATTTDGADHTDGAIGGNQTAKKQEAKKGSDTASARQHHRHVHRGLAKWPTIAAGVSCQRLQHATRVHRPGKHVHQHEGPQKQGQ